MTPCHKCWLSCLAQTANTGPSCNFDTGKTSIKLESAHLHLIEGSALSWADMPCDLCGDCPTAPFADRRTVFALSALLRLPGWTSGRILQRTHEEWFLPVQKE